jgi:hypothetical protein
VRGKKKRERKKREANIYKIKQVRIVLGAK